MRLRELLWWLAMLARIRGLILELNLSTPPTSATIAPSGSPGLGYEVLLPAYLAERLAAGRAASAGSPEEVQLFTIQYLEGVNQGVSFTPRLIGFASVRERAFFELLTSVKGLGNKRALRAMVVPPGSVARAIADRDARYLQRLPEIGPKLAELIVHELKSKAGGFVDAIGGEPDARESGSAALDGARAEAKPLKRADAPSRAKTPKNATTPPNTPASTGPNTGVPARQPIRETIDALVALGESPIDAERMVMRAVEQSRASGTTLAGQTMSTQELLGAAYAARA